MPIFASGDETYSVSASCAATEDLPTPPLPEQTMMMCLMWLKRRETGVSVIDAEEKYYAWLNDPEMDAYNL
jgi:hypothetical protein